MLDFFHRSECIGICKIFIVGINMLKNVGYEWVVVDELLNAKAIIFTLYCFSNKWWSNNDWESKDIIMDSKSILANLLNGCIHPKFFDENRLNRSIDHVKKVVPPLKRDSSLKIKHCSFSSSKTTNFSFRMNKRFS